LNITEVCNMRTNRKLVLHGDQKVSVHLMITVQKHAKIFQTVSITYHDNVVIIKDNRWR
jgi:hypothetical protein